MLTRTGMNVSLTPVSEVIISDPEILSGMPVFRGTRVPCKNLLDYLAAVAISRIKGIKRQGTRTGNWLDLKQAQALLNAPDITTLEGVRDRALLAVPIGCGLRRTEVSDMTFDHIQQRHGRWVLVDLIGKGGRIRSVPMPSWCKNAIDAWAADSGITMGWFSAP
jgi:integrase/recombinase XerD